MHVHVIVVPFDSGHRDTRMGLGPAAVLEAGLVDRLRAAGADVRTTIVEPPTGLFPSEVALAVALQREVARHVTEARRTGVRALVLSGNCNSAVGAVSGLMAGGATLPAVCWLDAHADFNTPETTTSGFFDGMALAMLAGHCWQALAASVPGFRPVLPSQIVLIGARDVEPAEEALLREAAIPRVAVGDLGVGLSTVLGSMPGAASEAYLHVDLDVLDPSEGRANDFAAAGGVTLGALHDTITRIRQRFRVGAMTLSAYDPAGDPDRRVARAAVDLALRLVEGERATTTSMPSPGG
jgi:arginase